MTAPARYPTAQSVLEAYEQRINQHDFDQLVDLLAPDAVFWFSDGTHVGLDAIRAAFEATWRALANDHYGLDDKHWIAAGATAATCLYRFNWRTTIDGRPVAGSGRGTTVLSRASGRWLIVHEHLSGHPIPPHSAA